MIKYFIIFSLSISSVMAAATPAQLFYIQRNKNSNEVHYEILLSNNCKPKKDEPVRGYWKELERGPDVISEIGTFEQVAYGVIDQEIKGDVVNFKMKAIPQKDFKARIVSEGDNCKVEALTTINNKEAILKKVYIFAVEGIIRPKVKYIDLFGISDDGKEIKERMNF